MQSDLCGTILVKRLSCAVWVSILFFVLRNPDKSLGSIQESRYDLRIADLIGAIEAHHQLLMMTKYLIDSVHNLLCMTIFLGVLSGSPES